MVIVPSDESLQSISVLVMLKSGAGIISTVNVVLALQLLESTTVISYTPGVVTTYSGTVCLG